MSTCTVGDVTAWLERRAPRWMAKSGDPGGLQAGAPHATARRVLLAVDATLPVIAEATAWRASLIITHHPRIYLPLAHIAETNFQGRVASALLRSGAALWAMHTNWDAAPGGVGDALADAGGLPDEREPVEIIAREALLKLAVFVPDSHAEPVRAALCDAGAGHIGRYADCTFRARGIGTFRGDETTQPFVGKAGELENADEWRLETVVPEHLLSEVLKAMRAAHPYEEIAFDLVPLRQHRAFGLGRAGLLDKPSTLGAWAKKLVRACGARGATLLGDPARKIRRAAVWGGSGFPMERIGDYDAVAVGEMGYHDQEVAVAAGAGVVILGHAESEAPAFTGLAEELREAFPRLEIRLAKDDGPRAVHV